MRSGGRARRSRAWQTGSVRRSTCSRRPSGDLELRLRARVEGDEPHARLLRFGGAARRQPQLPARRHPLGLLLRGARPDRSRRAAVRGRLPADRGGRGAAARCSTRARPPRWSPATSRPRRGSPTSCSRRSAEPLGQGTMNNLTLGNDDFTYYETLGGGQGACRRRRRAERRPRRDEQHAQHPGRGARARVSAALRRVLPAARVRGRRACSAAATASSASSRRSRPMTYSLLTERRRARPAGRGGRRRRRAAAATSWRARRCPRSPPAGSSPATGCGSRRPAAEATAAENHAKWVKPARPRAIDLKSRSCRVSCPAPRQ